jgi:hypothetical protein
VPRLSANSAAFVISTLIGRFAACACSSLAARRNPRYMLCSLATDERALNELLKKHKPDLLLLEPFLGKRDGIFLLKELATEGRTIWDYCRPTARTASIVFVSKIGGTVIDWLMHKKNMTAAEAMRELAGGLNVR